ncbi:OsmC family protein [Longimicrobium sp.]|uniref:OsmC family protein n=1 Tax=Longimicrobium sp. TaxID=2029185 RepID=UPI002E345355|nr:OsmC family protein [Longimicrobium sp.]HEX6037514.1 OsmC family protein [Longimicrobium sp.]
MPDGVPAQYPIEVAWEGGMRWRGGPAGGPTLLMDGTKEQAPSPVDALVASIAACSAIDVVDYLEKRRTPATTARVSVRFSRAPEPPRRLTDLHLTFHVATDSPREHVERAVKLSFDKYCSVANSLAPDIRTSWDIELSPPMGGE